MLDNLETILIHLVPLFENGIIGNSTLLAIYARSVEWRCFAGLITTKIISHFYEKFPERRDGMAR